MKYVSIGKFNEIVNKEIENLKCNTDIGMEYIMNDDWEKL